MAVPTIIASSTLDFPIPGQKIPFIDTTSWLIHADTKIGYSVEYPPNLIPGGSADQFTVAFPKNLYFHWPLLDDVKVTVSVSPHSCPNIATHGPTDPSPIEFAMNGYKFSRNISTDVGAGQLYTEVTYDTLTNGSCYRIDLLDHGTNGAGFYVDDVSLVKKYDGQHAVDMAGVIDVLNSMVGTLRVLAQSN